MQERRQTPSDTSWNRVSNWYDQIVSKEGHYYHQEVIFPHLEKCFFNRLKPASRVIELACGQGVLERKLHPSTAYLGVDLAPQLIKAAMEKRVSEQHRFLCQDATKPLATEEMFDFGVMILALQNVKEPLGVMKNFSAHLKKNGRVDLIINHPVFRIPRQSSWGVDESKKIQFRRVDRYMSAMEIPINMQPSLADASEQTLSYHHPLSFFSKIFAETGFAILSIDELLSNKKSEGKMKKMEDRARAEFPLFMAFELMKL